METSQYNCNIEYLKTTLSSSEINKLEKIGKCISVPTNYVLVHAGDIISHCYFIKEGRILACEYTETGEKRIYTSFEKNSLVLEEYLLTGQICQIEYMTVQPSELIQIDRDILFHIIDTDPSASKCIMKMMAEKLLFSEELFRHEKNKSATWKICSLFMEFAGRYGVTDGDKVIIQEKFSQQFIADILGMNRITIVREMKTLKEKKLIDKIEGYYCILDIEKLQQYQRQLT